MNTLSEYHPRTEGSAGERRTFEYIRSLLRSRDITFTTRDFSSAGTIHSFSAAVEAVFPGSGSDTLYFLVPVNHPPQTPPGRDGSAGIALGLSLCRRFADSSLPLEVRVLFLGAEGGGSTEYSRGSRAFLQDFYSAGNTAFLYLHYPAVPSKTELLPASTSLVTPYWLLERTAASLRQSGVPLGFHFIRFQLYRLGLNDRPTPIHPYLEAGYPALLLSGEEASNETDFAALEQTAAALEHLVSEMEGQLPRTWDHHYQFLPFEDQHLRITQQEYVLGLLLLFALVLLYPFLRSKHFLKYGRSIVRNAGALPILYLLMFLYLYLATLLLEGVTLLKSYPLWWQDRPMVFILLKLSAAGFLFFLTHRLVHMIRFTRLRGSFYSASALVFFLLDIIILSIIDLTLSLYGAAVFLFAFLFSIARHRIVKVVFLLLALAATVIPMYLVFSSGMTTAIYPLLLSRTTGNLLIAFHFLPFMLLIIRVRILFHHPNPRITRRIIYAFDVFFGGLTAALLAVLLFSAPFGAQNPQPIRVSERQVGGEQPRLLQLRSPAPLGEFTFIRGSERLEVDTQQRELTRRLPQRESLLEATVSKEDFLNRALYTLTVNARHHPSRLRVRITSEGDIILYDARFPVTYSTDRRQAQFHIGRNPPIPLEVPFTLPASFEGEVTVEAEYEQPPRPVSIEGKAARLEYRLLVERTLPIRGYR